MTPLDFLNRIGPERFGAVWAASVQSPAIAYAMMRGFAAQSTLLADSFPTLIQLEQAGVLPPGTAIEVWS